MLMINKTSGVALLLLTCLLSVSLFVSGQTRASAHKALQQRESTVIFAVSGGSGNLGASMEPLVIIEGSEYKNPLDGSSSAEELAQFASTYYRKGRKYRVLSGGGEAGSLTVKKDTKDAECARSGAEVNLSTSAKLNRNVMVLATNSTSLGSAAGSRRPPTPDERAAAVRLAKQAYTAKGVSAGLLPTLETVNLTAMDLDRDGKAELVGSFVVKKSKGGAARYVLFLLAEPQGKDYRASVSNYEKFTNEDVMSGGDIDWIGANGVYTERLVDQLDLDGDGTGEVITVTNGLEGDTYHIYKKTDGKWNSIYEFGKYRCAF